MFRLILFLGLISLSYCGANYYIYATTWDTGDAGTDSDIYIRLHGYKGVTSWYLMDLSINDFTRGDTDYYNFYRSEDVGQVLCAEMHTGGSDALLVYKLQVASSSSSWVTIYNRRGQWLSRDSSEGITQDKWCQTDCGLDLPIYSSSWYIEKTDYNLAGAVVTNLTPTVLDSHVMDATSSTQDMETEYFVSDTAVDTTTFTKTGGVMIGHGIQFSSHPITVVNSAAAVDTSTTVNYQLNIALRQSEAQSSWYGCRAPAGKKVKCEAVMDKTQVRIPFTQTWRSRTRGSCTWMITGQVDRVWDSKVEQRIQEL